MKSRFDKTLLFYNYTPTCNRPSKHITPCTYEICAIEHFAHLTIFSIFAADEPTITAIHLPEVSDSSVARGSSIVDALVVVAIRVGGSVLQV